jgi:Flp pilus assembly protein TadD
MSNAGTLLLNALRLDAAGREKEAIPIYRRAIALGLAQRELHTTLVCLGSSLTTTGQTGQAIRTLQRARRLFPRDPTVILFLALAHAHHGQQRLALRQLGDVLLKTSTDPVLREYRTALQRKYHALR